MTSESTPFLLFPPGTDPSLPGPRAMALLVPAAPSRDDNPEEPEPPQQTLAYVYPLLREGKFVLQWRNLPCMADAMTRDRLVLDGALPMCTRMPPTAEPYHPDRDTGFFFIDTEGNQQDVAELLRGVLPAPLDPLDAEAAAVVERFAFGDIPISGAPANGFMWPERKSTPAYFALLRVAEQRPPLPGDEYLVDDMPQPPPPAPPVNPAPGGEPAATRKRAHESEDGADNDEERAVKRARTQEPVPMNSTRAALPGEPTGRGNAGIIPRHALPGARGAINDEVPIPMDVTTTSTADEAPALAARRAPLPRDPHGAADGALRTAVATPPVPQQVDLTHATHATPPAPPRSGTGAHVPRNVVARVGPPPPPAPPDLALPGLLGPGGFRGVPQTPNPFMFADDDASPALPAPPRLILPPSARIPLAAPPAPAAGQPLAPAPTAPGAPLMPTLAAGSLPADALPSVSKAPTPLPAKSAATAATAAPGTPPRSARPPAASSPLTTTPVTTPAVPQWNIPQVTPQTEQQPTSPLFSEEPSSPTAGPARPLPAGTPPSQAAPVSPARHLSPVKNTPPRRLSLEGLTPATTLKPATPVAPAPATVAPAVAFQASQPRSTPSTPARSARSPSRTPAPTTKEEPAAPRPPSPAPVAAPPPVPSGRGIPECVMEPPSLTERPPSPGQRSVSSGGTRGRGPGRSKKAPAVPSLEEEAFAFLKELQTTRKTAEAAGLPLEPLTAPMEGVVATTTTTAAATTAPSAPIAAATAPRLKTVSGTTEEEPQEEERNDNELEDSQADSRPGRKKAAAKKGAKKAAAKKASAKKAAARKIHASEESAEEPVQQRPPSPSPQQDLASSAAPPMPPPLQAATPPRAATPPAASAAASSAEKGKSGEGESASTPAATPAQPKRRGRPKGWKKPVPVTSSEPVETPAPRPPTPPASPPLPASSSDTPAAATPVVKRKGRPPKNRPAETPVPDLPALASPVAASNEPLAATTTEPVAKAQPRAKATPAAKATLGYKSTPAAKEAPAKSSPAAKSTPVTVIPRKTSALVEADLPAAPAPVRKKPGPKPKPKPDNQPAEVTMIDRAAKQAANQVFGAKAPEVSPPRKKAAAAASASPERLPAGKGKASAKGKGKAKAKAVPTDEPVTALPLSVLRRSEPPASRRREPSQTPMPTGESEGEEEGERSSGQEQRPGTSNDEQETDVYPEREPSAAVPMQVDSGTPAPSEQSSPQRKTVPFTPGSLWLPGSPALEYTLRNSLAAGQLEGGDESHLETMEGVVRGGAGYQPAADEEMPQAAPLITTTAATTNSDQHTVNESAPARTLERTERSPSAHGSGLTPGLSGQAATPAYSDPGRATTVVNTPATPEGALGLHDKSSQPSQPSQQSLTASGSVLLAGLKSPHLAGTERTLNEHSLNPRPASPFIVGAAVTTTTTTAALSPTSVAAVTSKSTMEPSHEPVPAPARMRSPPPPHSAPLPARPTPRSPTTAVPATPPFEVTVQGEVRSPGGRVLATPANPGHSPPSHVMHAAYPPAQSPYRPQNFGAPFDFSDVGPFEGESHEDFMAMLFRSAQSPGQGAFYERNLPPRPSSAGAIPSPATHDDALRMDDPRQVAPNYYGLSNTPLLPLHGLSTPMLPPTPARSPSLMPHTPAPSMHPELTVAFAPHAAPLRPPSGLLSGVHEMAESFVAQDATRRTAGVSPVTVQQPQPTYPLSVPQSSPRPPPVVSAIGLNHSPAPALVAPTPPPPPPMASEPPSELPLPPVFAGAQELEPTAAATMMATDTDTPESLESGVPVSARDSLSPPLAVAQPNHQPFRWRGVADVPGSPTLVPRAPTAAPAPPAAPLAESVVASETAASATDASKLGETGTRKRPHSPEPSDQTTAATAEGPALPSDQAPPSKRVPPATLAPSPPRSVVNNRASRDVFGVVDDASCQLINTFFNLPADSPQRLRVYTPVSADDLARGALPGDGNSFFACMHIAIIGGHQAMGWGVQAARHHVIHERSGDMKKELSEMKALLEKDMVDSHRVVREFFLNDPETRQAIDQYKAGGPVNDAHLGRSRRFEDWIRSEGPPEVDEFLVSQTESAYKTNCIILDVTNIKRVEGALKLTVAYRNDLSMFDVRKDPLGMNLFLLHGPVDYNNPAGPQIYRVVTCPTLRAMEQDEPMTGLAAAARSDAGEGEAGEEWVRFLPRDLPSGLANDLRSGSLGRTVVLPLDQV